MRLTDSERAVISAIELEADAPLDKVRKLTRLRDHTIRYNIAKLEDAGIIRKQVFVNVYPLGFADYCVYFSAAAQSSSASAKLIEFLVQSDKVSWVAQLGGDYQYGFSICAKNLLEITSVLDAISHRFADVFFEKSLSIRVALTLFSRKYLNEKAAVRSLSFGGSGGGSAAVDETDRKILSSLSNSPFNSFRDLARQLGMPHATLLARVHRLEKLQLVAGYIYSVDATKFGMSRFRLLIYTRGMNREFGKELRSFAEKHRSVVYFIECLGSWDFEIGAEVESSEQIVGLTQELYNAFGSTLNTIKVLPLFGHPKVTNYPFKA